jgi:hypothetical protein
VHPEAQLVDQAGPHEAMGQMPEAVMDDVRARRSLERPHERDGFGGDDLGVAPFGIAHPRREDELSHRVDVIAVWVTRARGPHRREALVGAAAHDLGIAALQEVVLDGEAAAVILGTRRGPGSTRRG